MFRQLFTHSIDSFELDLGPSIHTLLTAGQVEHFCYTLNRVCYILINNWDTARKYDAIVELVEILSTSRQLSSGVSPKLRKLRSWLGAFTASKAFQQLKVYTSRYEQSPHWTQRYTSYLLAIQYLNPDSPEEQRQIAYSMSSSIKYEFKRNLALYTVQSEKSLKLTTSDVEVENPTLLGENILPLIKTILTKKGQYSCQNLANIFLAQAQELRYRSFKRSLLEYLIFPMTPHASIDVLSNQLSGKIGTLYSHYDDHLVSESIRLRTANRVIEWLTTEKQGQPSAIAQLLLAQGRALTLAVLLLKVVMISPKSQAYLEARIGNLVEYHQGLPEEECQWLIQFLEILRVTFTIYSDRTVNYSLVSMPSKTTAKSAKSANLNLNSYRIFSTTHSQSKQPDCSAKG
ncbi:MAG: hypothetical protein F6K30_09460 [Cyanothece sp. SIO2G6]|nr:hypothetical protein [Cyanothece sp. SIO2G6]